MAAGQTDQGHQIGGHHRNDEGIENTLQSAAQFNINSQLPQAYGAGGAHGQLGQQYADGAGHPSSGADQMYNNQGGGGPPGGNYHLPMLHQQQHQAPPYGPG